MKTREPDDAETIAAMRADILRLLRCINMAMGCLDPCSSNWDERLAWYRLHDALDGKEPRERLDRT